MKQIQVLDRIVQQMQDAVMLVNDEMCVVYVNKAFLRMYGYTEGEIVGQRSQMLFGGMPAEFEVLSENLQSSIERDGIFEGEYQGRRRDGTLFWVSNVTSRLYLDKRQVYWLSIIRDITEQKRVQDTLRQLEDKLRLIFDYAFDGISIYEEITEGERRIGRRLLECNERYAEMAGRSKEELLAMQDTRSVQQPFKLMLSDDQITRERFYRGLSYNGLFSWFRPDGKENIIEYNAMPISVEGKILIVGIDRDTTLQKRAEDTLRQERDLVTRLMETSPAGILVLDRDYRITYANARAEEVLGLTKDPSTYRSIPWRVVDYKNNPFPTDKWPLEYVLDTGQTVYNVGHTIEWPDGHSRSLSVNMAPLLDDGQVTGVVITVEDVTEWVQAEERAQDLFKRQTAINDLAVALGQSNNLHIIYQTIYDHVRSLIDVDAFIVSSYDPQTQLIHAEFIVKLPVSPDVASLPPIPLEPEGMGAQSIVIRTGKPLHIPDWRKQMQQTATEYAITDEGQVVPGPPPDEAEQVTRSAILAPMLVAGQVIGVVQVQSYRLDAYIQEDLDMLAALANVAAVSVQRARVDQALHENQERYRIITNNMTDTVWLMDMNFRTTFISPSVERTRGYTLAELQNMSLEQHMPPSSLQVAFQTIAEEMAPERLASTGLPISKTLDLEFYRKDGTTFWSEICLTVLRDIEGRPSELLGVGRDITERKQAEAERRELQEQLERAQRMESLGILAGGVAHDLNNLLGPLVAYPDLILMDLPEDSPARSDVLQIQQAAEKAAAVVQDLLTLSRRGAYRMAPLDLNLAVKEYLHSPSFVELCAKNPFLLVKTDLDAGLMNIAGSMPHLSKVIMNLVVNACEAMPHGGQLTIATSCQSLDQPVAGYERIEAGDYVVLRVTDDGAGIEAKDLSKIFEPFYTKKQMGRGGSGLGLAVVYGVVHDHQGRIDVRTEVGHGADFILYFPITHEIALAADESITSYTGAERVLVVDDLPEQRSLASRLLASLGYQVATAENGHHAVEYLRENHTDIILLDMIMEEGFDGLDTYREIIKLHPGQKAVIASGFSETARIKDAQQLGAGQFIKKPYTRELLGKAIRKELDQ